eukprot:g2341.t1
MTNMRARKTAFAFQAIVGLGSGVGVGVALQPPSPGEKKFANGLGEFTEFTDKTDEEDVNNGPGDGYEVEARSASFHQEGQKAGCADVDETTHCLPCIMKIFIQHPPRSRTHLWSPFLAATCSFFPSDHV